MHKMRKSNLPAWRRHAGLSAVASAAMMALGGLYGPAAVAATPPSKAFLQAGVKDQGIAAPGNVKSITVSLAARNGAAIDPLIASLNNPSSPNFRQFLTPAQFAAQFGQSPEAVAQVVAYLQSMGFTIDRVHASNLLITAHGTNAQINAAFNTTVHAYTQGGVAYEAPATAAVIPAQFAGIVSGVTGLSNKSFANSHRVAIPNSGALAGDVSLAVTAPSAAAPATGTPGSYTVSDLAAKYNINPLYAKGYTGAGRTIGIATLAGYDQSDVYAYWSMLGLSVASGRITDVAVDGGPLPADGPGSEGAGETTLDVEQSGGVAPGANIRVYLAPNTDSGFIDAFGQAVEENLVDVLSASWGSPEIANDGATLNAYHMIFAQAALQGIPVIASSGDAGAYDINRSFTYPACTTALTVDFPAADPYVLAAGGTTLPNTVIHKHGPVTVTTERAWGWDYLKPYIVDNYGQALYYASYFTVGGGGGVSVDFALPFYQAGLAGVATSAPAQALLCSPALIGGTTYQLLAVLPAKVPGRNLPDVSLNADPYSGYSIYFGGKLGSGSGGTSFVAPQLNGILTLISQGIAPTVGNPKGRVGFPAPQLYSAFAALGYGAGSPFRAITAGTNEFYPATASYNPATGLGSVDVNQLAATLGATP